MLDIKFLRENPSLVEENIKKKFQKNKFSFVNEILKKDKEWRKTKLEVDKLRHQRNQLSQEVNKLKKENKDIRSLVKSIKEIPIQINNLEKKEKNLKEEIYNLQSQIPNILHSSVPTGKDASQNKVIKKYGVIPKFSFPIKTHVELVENLNIVDFDASARTSGTGFYYLKNELALLNQALIRFTIEFMLKKKYQYIEPPLMVKDDIAKAAEDFEEFKNKIYRVEETNNLNLIPTSEHALLGMLKNQTISEEKLPLKFFSYSMCFRKEIGSHGINEKGLWRTHQFNKVEQFIFCKPKDSWKYYEELRKNSEQLFQKLKLPYRILLMCSSETGDWKAKTEDIEIYRPTTKDYGEVGSLSNCTGYQARDLNIKGEGKKGNKYVLHTLNNTAIATSRVMVAILENYQQKDGSVKIPTALQKYMYGIKRISHR